MRLLAALAVLALWSTAAANPMDVFGLGPRGQAMAGAQVAAVDDTSASYYNPAVLATLENLRIDVSYQYAKPSLRINDLDLGVDTAKGFAFGAVAPGQVGPVRVALGMSLYLPDEYLIRTRALSAEQPRFQLYDNRPQRYYMAVNGSLLVGNRLGIGGGVTYMSGTQGTVNLSGRLGFPDPEQSDLALAIDYDIKSVQYLQAGLWYRALPWLDIALSYRGEFNLELNQVVAIRGDVGLMGMEPVVEDGFFEAQALAQDHFQPMQLTAGMFAKLTPFLSLAFDLSWHRWSAFENPATDLLIDLDVGQFNDQVNIPPSVPFADPNFSDIIVPRLGLEYVRHASEAITWSLRGGYTFEPSPAPQQIGSNNHVDNHKHTLSLGGGLRLDQVSELIPLPFSVDAFVALGVLPSRTHAKLSPTDPVGDYQSAGRVYQAGLGTRWRF